MALEGLFPGKGQRGAADDCNNLQYPKLGDLLDYIVSQMPPLLDSNEMREAKLLFPSKTYLAMITFLLKCFEADVEQYRRGDRIVEYWPSVGKMCSLLEHAMAYEGSVELHANASKALITVGSHFPEVIFGFLVLSSLICTFYFLFLLTNPCCLQIIESRYATKVSWLKQLLGHTDIDTRESVARLLGIASGALSLSALPDLISELISPIAGSQKLRFVHLSNNFCKLLWCDFYSVSYCKVDLEISVGLKHSMDCYVH